MREERKANGDILLDEYEAGFPNYSFSLFPSFQSSKQAQGRGSVNSI